MQGTKFISVFSGKGGVGKSMLTILLADYISSSNFRISKNKLRPFKVLILDFDDQCSSARDIIGEENVISIGDKKLSLPDVIEKLTDFKNLDSVIPSLIASREKEFGGRALKLGNVDVINSINDSAIVEYIESSIAETSKKIAKNLKKYFEGRYDFVLIDLPGSNIPNNYSLIGLLLAEHFVIPTSCSPMEVFSLPKTFNLFDKLKVIKGTDFDLHVHGLVFNMLKQSENAYRSRRSKVKRIARSNGVEKIYEPNLPFNPSIHGIGLDEVPNFRQKWQVMFDPVRKLAKVILADLGLGRKT